MVLTPSLQKIKKIFLVMSQLTHISSRFIDINGAKT